MLLGLGFGAAEQGVGHAGALGRMQGGQLGLRGREGACGEWETFYVKVPFPQDAFPVGVLGGEQLREVELDPGFCVLESPPTNPPASSRWGN